MGSFLDKVGLQHFVEKIKGLLSGYLPLSGGTMTGTIKYGDVATLNEMSLIYRNAQNNNCKTELDSDGLNTLYVYYNHPKYGNIQRGLVQLNLEGLNIFVTGVGQANFSVENGTTKKFVLSGDSSSEGLIANNSETVIPEVASSVIDEVVQNKGAEYTDAGYVSKANLGRLVKNLYDNISTNANNQ